MHRNILQIRRNKRKIKIRYWGSNLAKSKIIFYTAIASVAFVCLIIWNQSDNAARAYESSNLNTSYDNLTTYNIEGKTEVSMETSDQEPSEPHANGTASVEPFQRHSKNYDDDWCLQHEVKPTQLLEASHEIFDFLEQRGLFEVDITYDSYDIATLKDLGSNGDRRALFYLYSRPNVTEDVKAWAINQSFLNGDTVIAKALSEDLINMAIANNVDNGDPMKTRNLFLRGVTIAVFGDRRDPENLVAITLDNLLQNSAVDLNKGEFRLHKSDFLMVQQNAQLMHSDLDQKRMELGLAPLENKVPPLHQYFKNKEMAKLLNKYGSLQWLEEIIPQRECVYTIQQYLN
jgi:hypothetical protein